MGYASASDASRLSSHQQVTITLKKNSLFFLEWDAAVIYFQQKPDPVFTAILHDALELLIEDLGEMVGDGDVSLWEANFPLSAQCFKPKIAIQVAERHRQCSVPPTWIQF